jgi:hypothetical protein
MFLDYANPDTSFLPEEREKCEVLYPGSGLLHDHVGRFILVELVGLQDAARLRLVPRQHQCHLAQNAEHGQIFLYAVSNSVADPNPGSGAF